MTKVSMKLSVLLYFFHNVQVLVAANRSSFQLLYNNSRKPRSAKFDEYLIHTPGCNIPNVWLDYQIVETNDCKNRCGKRAVFVERFKDNMIEFTFNEKRIIKFLRNQYFVCCSQFAYPHHLEPNRLEFTDCEPFQNGTKRKILHETLTVTCRPTNKSSDIEYEDAYIVVRRLESLATKNHSQAYNVLLVGMDTMSRARAIQSMPKLVKYFKENDWLDHRGFQKSLVNTVPNLMITHTGNYLTVEKCAHDGNLCNNNFIWNNFRSNGFVTAYGEDGSIHTFQDFASKNPTDHYTRPFFNLGTKYQGNIVCVKTKPCAYHILEYAYQFAEAYRDDKYFGFFWISNYSHDPVHLPTLVQNQFIHLFKRLENLSALNNTIVFFFGDHGVRYGKLKIPVASFYDDRLPMLYMWFPHSFRKNFKTAYSNLILNQRRLTSHSDLHSTLWNILRLSNPDIVNEPPKYCPACDSLFEEKSKFRNCGLMNVPDRWCSCHALNEVRSTDIAATLVPEILLHHVNGWDPKTQYQIKKILRNHWFRNDYDFKANTTYYAIAVEMVQGDKQYEGVIKQQNSDYVVVGEVDNISPRSQYFDTSQC